MHLQVSTFCCSHFVVRAAALAAFLCAAAAARADHDLTLPDHHAVKSPWTFSGFGTIGMVHADTDQADFTSNVLKRRGAGYSRSWSTEVDSRLGAQLGVAIDKKWSGVVQVVSEQALDGSFSPVVEWANVKYQATPDLALRIGRIALPVFLAADYRKVGYAYAWARTPVEVYGSVPITNNDGIETCYRWRVAGIKNVTQAFYGRTVVKVTETSRAKARALAGISNSIEYGAASGRISILGAELTMDIARDLFNAFRQFGATGMALANAYDVDHKQTTAVSIGGSYDPGAWFVMAEVGHMNTRSFLGKTKSVYASGGYRFGEFTPYLAYAQVKAANAASQPGLPLAGLPPAVVAAAAALNAGLAGLLSGVPIQKTITAGVRWDFRPDLALKLQYDHVRPSDGSRGTLINPQPEFRSGQGINVASIVLDFVY